MRYYGILLLVLLAACRPPEPSSASAGNTGTTGGLRVRLELSEKNAVGPAPVRVYLLGGDNQAVTDAQVSVTGTMTHAGMEPVTTQAVPTEAGLYQAQDFAFTMAGDWILQADVTLTDGSEAQSELNVTVPGN